MIHTPHPRYGWHPTPEEIANAGKADEFRYIKLHSTWWETVKGKTVGPIFLELNEIENDPDNHLEMTIRAA